MNSNFTHLHVHNTFSVLDGLGKADEYCKRAKEIGFKSLAITNHGNVDGCLNFQKVCKEHNIKPIFGVEAYIVPDLSIKEKGEKKAHIVLLAANKTGWQNILKMMTVANIDGYYYKPRIDSDLLLDNCEGVIVGSACISSFLNWSKQLGIKLLKDLIKKGTTCYLEIMPIDMDEQRSLNKLCCILSEEYNIPLVATIDAHYVLQEHKKAHEVLLAIQTKKTWNDPSRWKFDVDTLYLQSVEEMSDNFMKFGGIKEKYWKKAIENTKLISDMCNLTLEPIKVELPDVYIPEYKDLKPDEQLMNLTLDGWEYRKNRHDWITEDKYNVYIDRLYEEIGLICSLGFSSYFLIVYELLNWCRDNNIMCGPGRGSSGSSLVAFCLGITQVDPIKYDLIFSRFINPARIDLPDIDMDFEKERRKEVIEHLKDIYGKDNIAGISNFLKMKGRTALKNVSRVFQIPLPEVQKACDVIMDKTSIKESFEQFEDGIEFKKKYPEIVELASVMEDCIYAHGRHAAGVCVAKNDLRSGKNMAYAKRSDTYCCNWNKDDSEYNGLMKLDVLGLQSLDVLHRSKDLIKKRKNVDIDYDIISLEDPKILSEFNKGNCAGIFQFHGSSIMRFCKEIGIEKFQDIVAMNALHRPGTLKSGTIHTYKNRKHGTESVRYDHPIIEKITKYTQGIILYQEQTMKLVYECAGLSWEIADKIRKLIAKSKGEKEIMKFHDLFVKGCIDNNTLNEKQANEFFEIIKSFGDYQFNEIHSVEYSMISYWQMYLKVYFPAEFISVLLSHGNKDKKNEYMQNARKIGLKILLPDVNKSDGLVWNIIDDNKLSIPLLEIKGIGEKAISNIIKNRIDNPYSGPEDLKERTSGRIVNSRVRSLLEKCYCYENKSRLDLTEEELGELNQYFDFSLSNDPMYKYRKLINKIREHVPLGNIKTSAPFGLIIGYVHDLKFFTKKNDDDGSIFSSCYAQIQDEKEEIISLNFDRDLYLSKKKEIEAIDEKWIIGRRIDNNKPGLVTISQFWLCDDLLEGKLDDLEIYQNSQRNKVAFAEYRKISNAFLDDTKDTGTILGECKKCEFHGECSDPVYPDEGRMNAMIISEMPNKEDDRRRHILSGDVGNLIFYGNKAMDVIGLADFGIKRSDLWVTSFVKCHPSATKKPKAKHINACKIWLEREIKAVRPFVILAIGNIGLHAIKKQSSGINSMTGKIEWNDEYECFVVHCANPASIFYSPDNSKLYNKGILSFLNIYLSLGFF